MKSLLFFAITVIFTFPGLSNGFSTGSYFPLSAGALWTFQSNGSGSYTTTVLPGTANINGTDTKMLQYWDGAVDYFTNDGYGIRLHAEYLPGDESIPESFGIFNPPIKIAEADSTLGVPVYSSGTATVQITGYGSFIFNYTSTVMPQAFESVTVPAGTFTALRVQWTQNIWGTVYGTPIRQIRNVTYWMAQNIGPVKQIDPYTTSTLIYSTLIDTEPANLFGDVSPEYWAFDYIVGIYNAGITAGCSNEPLMYCPEEFVTREQMATFLIRAIEPEPQANYCDYGLPFTDVTADMWSCSFIKRLKELGITEGYPDGRYGPNDLVSREQMAAFLVVAGEGAPAANYCDSGIPFADVTANMWSCGYIKRLAELGITTGYGDGRYGPWDALTRAQMAVLLSRAFLGM